MKKLVVLFLSVLPWMAAAQTHPCNPQWHPWQTVHEWKEGRIEYRFQSAACTPTGICGFPIIALKHTFPQEARIDVTFEGLDCQGRVIRSGPNTGFRELPPNQEYASSGNHHYFRQITSVVRVEVLYKINNDLYIALYDRERGIDKLTINGRTREEIAEEEAEKQRLLEEKEEARKQKEQERRERDEAQQRELARAEAADKEREEQAKRDEKFKEQQAGAASSESPHEREMRQRAEAQLQKNASEQQTRDAVMAGFGEVLKSAVGGDEDTRAYEKAAFYAKLDVGIGYHSIPVVYNETNNTLNTTQSQATTANPMGAHLGMQLAACNGRLVSFQATPFYNLGIDHGYHQSAGIGFTAGLGHRFKIIAKYEVNERSGFMTRDEAIFNMDVSGTVDYNYSVIRYGIGGRWALDDGNYVLEAIAFRDRLSFLQNSSARIYSYEAKFTMGFLSRFLGIGFNYGRNYPVAGKLLYATGYDNSSQNLFMITLYMPFTLFFKD